eukprot:1152275-Pelagomonas_calceolata.AAC.8
MEIRRLHETLRQLRACAGNDLPQTGRLKSRERHNKADSAKVDTELGQKCSTTTQLSAVPAALHSARAADEGLRTSTMT